MPIAAQQHQVMRCIPVYTACTVQRMTVKQTQQKEPLHEVPPQNIKHGYEES